MKRTIEFTWDYRSEKYNFRLFETSPDKPDDRQTTEGTYCPVSGITTFDLKTVSVANLSEATTWIKEKGAAWHDNEDLFPHYECLPEEISDLVKAMGEIAESHVSNKQAFLAIMDKAFQMFNYTFDYDMSGECFDLRRL